MGSSSKTNSTTNETQNQTQMPIVPPYASTALANLTGTTEALAAMNPQSFVAPQQPLQLAANAQGQQLLTGVNPNYGTASGILGNNAPSANFGQGSADIQANSNVGAPQIANFMNPYTQNVIGSENTLLGQQFGQQNAAMQAAAAATGAFGGDRYGVAQGVLGGQQALDRGNIDANLLNTGYQNAVQAALANAGLGQSAGVSLGNIGAQTGALNVANATALGNVGAQQTASNIANTAELANLGGAQQATAQAQAAAPLTVQGIIAGLLGQNQYGLLTGQNVVGNLTANSSTTTNPGWLSTLTGLFGGGSGSPSAGIANLIAGLGAGAGGGG